MDLNQVLEVAIGLAFLYLGLSLFASWTSEYISRLIELRAEALREGIATMLTGDSKGPEKLSFASVLIRELAAVPASIKKWFGMDGDDPRDTTGALRNFYNHPLIRSLHTKAILLDGKKNRPSYIPEQSFSTVLLDVVMKQIEEKAPEGTINKNIRLDQFLNSPKLDEYLDHFESDSSLGKTLKLLAAKARIAESDATKFAVTFQREIERWFNDTMDRVSSHYKRTSNQWVFLIALIITGLLNANTFTLAIRLWENPELRAQIVRQATVAVEETPTIQAEPTAANMEAGAVPSTEEQVGDAPQSNDGMTSPSSVSENQAPEEGPSAPLNDEELRKLRMSAETKLRNFPLGWDQPRLFELREAEAKALGLKTFSAEHKWAAILIEFFGLLVTAAFVSLGATFWFDTLSRLINLRTSGIKPIEGEFDDTKPR